MDISHIITKRPKERQRDGEYRDRGEQLPQPLLELDSPLPTPRRSCASTDHPRCRRDASPLRVRTQVPFSWESSPGVPKSRVVDVLHKNKAAPETTMPMPPPKPPPGRCASSRDWRYGNAGDRDTYTPSFFSVDALDKRTTIPSSSSSSPEQRAIGSGAGSFDRVTSKRFEDIFLGRASSFVKDGRCHPRRHALSDASSSSGRSSDHPKQWRRRHGSTGGGDDDGEPPPNTGPAVQVQVVPRINLRPRVEQMSPRACGLMVFFPWSAKPAVCGGFRSPSSLSQRATPRSSGASDSIPSSRSHSRRSTTTLRDALQEEKKTEDDVDIGQAAGLPRGGKRGREEWQGRGWGVSSLLGTSKKYCTDARKALSKLSIGLGSESGSPRVGRERNDRKLQDVPTTPAMATAAAKLTKIRTNRN